MTLHWWMHWFWITLMILSVCLCDPISSRLGGGLNDNLEHDPAAVVTSEMPAVYQNPRTGKAIGYSPKAILPTTYPTTAPYQKVSLIFPLPTSSDLGDDVASLQRELPHRIDSKKVVDTNINNKTNITSTTVATPVEKIKTATETILKIVPIINQTSQNTIKTSANSTIKPPEENRLIKNITQPNKNSTELLITENKKLNESTVVENTTNISDKNITILEQTTSAPVEAIKNESINVIEEEIEVSTVRALSLETAVGRRAIENPISPVVIITPDEDAPGLDAAAVSGICFGTLVLLALTGAISFVLYRRRYLNKPQTLNDKCSNPDSSGYIDDSTIRENSEEMYSLDNDSFLNSLEAMTIQNYWTDSVKHTKL